LGQLTQGADTTTANATLDLNDWSIGIRNLLGNVSGTIITGTAAQTTLTLSQGNFAGSILGKGQLRIEGGTVFLAGANSYSGGTTVSSGILQGNTTSLQGAIANNARLDFDQAADGTYSGLISGSGSLTKQGAGILNRPGFGGGCLV
jgi:autotransporter-associated beta strand protein